MGRSIVVYTKDTHPTNHPSFEQWGTHCVAGTWGSQYLRELYMAPGAYHFDKGFNKHSEGYSAFENGDLLELLQDHQIQTCAIMGVAMEYCVRHTAYAAMQHGFETVLLLDCCFPLHKSGMYSIACDFLQAGGFVQSSVHVPAPEMLPSNTAFIVVDMQNDFFYHVDEKEHEAALPIHGARLIIPPINKVLKQHAKPSKLAT